MRPWMLGIGTIAAVFLLGWRQEGLFAGSPEHAALPIPAPDPQPLEGVRHLPNAVQVHRRVISGGQPEGDAGFEELRRLGVQTVVSVDGAAPAVAAARRHGLRYVHLPHGYDGIPEQRVKELAKAVRDLDGPLYIHCHHGRHRSPAAASAACVAAGLLAPEQASAVLQLAGTSRQYRGLYRAVDEVTALDADVLDALDVAFRATVPVPPMAEAMVELERVHDRMQQIAAAGWQTPADHPDLIPDHQALLLREQFTELLRSRDVHSHPQAFRELLRDSEVAAGQLEKGLRHTGQTAVARSPAAAMEGLLGRITANCNACHMRFRDVPAGR